jgi:hypothetical protein
MSTMKDTTNLRPYVASNPPQLGADRLYLSKELKSIQGAIAVLIRAAQALEARLVAGGL